MSSQETGHHLVILVTSGHHRSVLMIFTQCGSCSCHEAHFINYEHILEDFPLRLLKQTLWCLELPTLTTL